MQKKVVIVQKYIRGFIKRRQYARLVKRTQISRELVKTEGTYVTGLRTLIDVWLTPLRNEPPPEITREQIKTIFSEVEVITNYNSVLLKDLEKRMASWSYLQTIADVLLRMTGFLKVYTQYVNNYNDALTVLNGCKRQSEAFRTFVEGAAADPRCKSLDLNSHLIIPVQRIPRYVLMLEDLRKSTPAWHPDAGNIKQALTAMRKVADYVEEKKSEAENIYQVLVVQDRLIGTPPALAKPSRRYLREGIVTESKKSVYAFLFNDLLVVTKVKGKLDDKKKPLAAVIAATSRRGSAPASPSITSSGSGSSVGGSSTTTTTTTTSGIAASGSSSSSGIAIALAGGNSRAQFKYLYSIELTYETQIRSVTDEASNKGKAFSFVITNPAASEQPSNAAPPSWTYALATAEDRRIWVDTLTGSISQLLKQRMTLARTESGAAVVALRHAQKARYISAGRTAGVELKKVGSNSSVGGS